MVLHEARSFLDAPLIHEMKDLVGNLKILSMNVAGGLTKNQMNVAISNAFYIGRKFIRIMYVNKQEPWLVI